MTREEMYLKATSEGVAPKELLDYVPTKMSEIYLKQIMINQVDILKRLAALETPATT